MLGGVGLATLATPFASFLWEVLRFLGCIDFCGIERGGSCQEVPALGSPDSSKRQPSCSSFFEYLNEVKRIDISIELITILDELKDE